MQVTVVILTKLPGHLPVKTRLVPALGEAGARAVYLEMLRETVALAKCLTPRPILAYSPPDATPDLPGVAGCELRPVIGDDGATCLENALADAYEAGTPLLALGGDAPDLPLARLEQVTAALDDDEADAVLVPTHDGGFSCLGLRRPVPGLAHGFRYGSADSLAGRIQVFDQDGVFLLDFGQHGSTPGQFQLPAGIAFWEDKLYVADSHNGRIQVFRYLGKEN